MRAELERLRTAIRERHGLVCTHIRSETVDETVDGKTSWRGVVEVFSCTDSPSKLVYAWEGETDDGGRRVATVVGDPPIRSALDAVRAENQAQRKS